MHDAAGHRIPGRQPARCNGYRRTCHHFVDGRIRVPAPFLGLARCPACSYLPGIDQPCYLGGVREANRSRRRCGFFVQRPAAGIVPKGVHVIGGLDTGWVRVWFGCGAAWVKVPLARFQRWDSPFRVC